MKIAGFEGTIKITSRVEIFVEPTQQNEWHRCSFECTFNACTHITTVHKTCVVCVGRCLLFTAVDVVRLLIATRKPLIVRLLLRGGFRPLAAPLGYVILYHTLLFHTHLGRPRRPSRRCSARVFHCHFSRGVGRCTRSVIPFEHCCNNITVSYTRYIILC